MPIAILLALSAAVPSRAARADPGVALVPADAESALILDGSTGIAGIRALLETAGQRAASLSPAAIGRSLEQQIGVDLLAEPPGWSLAPHGARALVTMRESIGLSAPVANVKAARGALAAWLGPAPRPTRPRPLKGPVAAGSRAGMIAPVAGSQRLLIASGPHAAALVSALAHPAPFSRDKSLLAQATGPAWLYLKGRPPLRGAIFALDASATGLIARGLVTPLGDPILAGGAPAPCDGAPIGCLRAGLGSSGHGLLAMALAQLQLPVPVGDAVVVRLDGIDLQRLSDARSLPRALRLSAKAGDAQPGTSLEGALDLAAVDEALARLTPLDAIRGPLAAGAYAAHLLYGPLLRNAGPLTLSGAPSGTGAEVELRLPVR